MTCSNCGAPHTTAACSHPLGNDLPLTVGLLKRITREIRDEKPDAWRAAAEAAIAAVRYGTQVPFAQWNAKRQEELDSEAQRLVQELDNARPE